MMEWTAFEDQARAEGYTCICGIDEAGRGPLAGPVYAAAVVLRPGQVIEGVNDSKKLTEKRRDALYEEITKRALAYKIVFISPQEIDERNILWATMDGMAQAVAGLEITPDYALIDGNRAKDFGLPVRTIVKGDSLSASIAAASILAKVTRDRLMELVWGMDYCGESRTVDMHIRTLRQKLGKAGAHITTVRGVGYRWEETL